MTSLNDGTTFTYDANGNMKTKTRSQIVTDYIYDTQNRLTEVKKSGVTQVKYEYDGDGGRTKKIAYVNGVAAATTQYVGSLMERTAGVDTKNIFLGSAQVASITNGKIVFYHNDHLGGTNVISDAAGVVKELIEYDPFGSFSKHEKYGSSEEVARFYFTGKKMDDESGLYYYGARYYDPSLGRFITPDTLVQNPGNPQTLNRYSYCGNNPVNMIDPTGHFFWAAIVAIFKAVTAAAAAVGSYVAANAAVIATGAAVGGVVGGVSAAAMGGNFWQGAFSGAIGGAIFAGLAPGLNILSDGFARGITLGGAAGPLTSGVSMASNFAAGFLGGAASGAAVAGINGTDVGQGALIGGAAAGTYSLLRDTGKYLRAKMIAQSRLDPNDSSGISEGLDGDGFKLGGNRWNNNQGATNAPSPLGGLQGGQGKFFGINYPPQGIINHVVESWAGPHDYLNSWAYGADGTFRQLSRFEHFVGGFTNPLNVAIAAPVAIPLMLGPTGGAAPSIIYGYGQRRSDFK